MVYWTGKRSQNTTMCYTMTVREEGGEWVPFPNLRSFCSHCHQSQCFVRGQGTAIAYRAGNRAGVRRVTAVFPV
jgi:hypothetical protein